MSGCFRGSATFPPNVLDICQYGPEGILNYAVDFSDGARVVLEVQQAAQSMVIRLSDEGVGVFHKIRTSFNLSDDQQAVLELSKGKLTTDRKRHSGEGLFFVRRAFDVFEWCSDRVLLRLDIRQQRWDLEPANDCPRGTRVTLIIAVNAQQQLQDIFDRFTSGSDNSGFTRTQVPICLARYGDENLVSRSQARRLLLRLDLFSDILFDFQDVCLIGQGFADEVFRVYPSQHLSSTLNWAHATPDIERMIRRAQTGSTPL